MSQDYSISKCTRKCSVTGEALAAGETYYSVVLPSGEDISRIDIAGSQWAGPPEQAIGWWKCKMPAAEARKLKPAPNGVLLDILSDLVERPGKESLAYLLALLLVRRRVLSEEETVVDAEAEPDSTIWNLTCSADGRQWNVPLSEPDGMDLNAIEQELYELLFTEE